VSSSTKIPFDIRSPDVEDLNFILDTWLKSYRQHSKTFKSFISSKDYTDGYRKVILTLLQHSTVHIAHSIDDKNQIYGYAVSNKGVVHYVYVKSPFRRFGIAKTLCNEFSKNNDIEFYTHYTHYAKGLVSTLSARYNPFFLMKGVNYGKKETKQETGKEASQQI